MANAGSFFYVSDYAHLIFWDGVTPRFADSGSGYYVISATAHWVSGLARGRWLNSVLPERGWHGNLKDVAGRENNRRVSQGRNRFGLPECACRPHTQRSHRKLNDRSNLSRRLWGQFRNGHSRCGLSRFCSHAPADRRRWRVDIRPRPFPYPDLLECADQHLG